MRYGFYRISEAFERAGIDAASALRATRVERGRGAELIGPATAARWDLQGVLIPLPDIAWDADPGGGEWSVRRTLGHVVTSQRGYALATSWWAAQGFAVGSPDLADAVPDEVWTHLPDEEVATPGTPADVRANLDDAVDHAAERLAGLAAERLEAGARWSGFPVDVAFRQSRWASHLREHTIQVEKTLVMIGHTPTEVDRLIRLILACWGRAESAIYGVSQDPGSSTAVAILASAAESARETAAQVAGL